MENLFQPWLSHYENARYPAMTTATEQAFYHGFARERLRGTGDVVELGCWLGAGARALIAGMRGNPAALERLPLAIYDYFQWDEVMEDWVAGTPCAGRLQKGDDFRAMFEEVNSDLLADLSIHAGDLRDAPPYPRPIELLVVDALKMLDVSNAAVRSFFPKVLPGCWILHQDFLHWFNGWLVVLHYRCRDFADPVYTVPGSHSVLFQIADELPASVWTEQALPDKVDDLTETEIDDAYRWMLTEVSPAYHHHLVASWIHLFVHRQQPAIAQDRLDFWAQYGFADTDAVEEMLAFQKRFGIADLER